MVQPAITNNTLCVCGEGPNADFRQQLVLCRQWLELVLSVANWALCIHGEGLTADLSQQPAL